MVLNQMNEPQLQPIQPEQAKPENGIPFTNPSENQPEADEECEPAAEANDIASLEEILSGLETVFADRNLQPKLKHYTEGQIRLRLGKKAIERLSSDEVVSEAINRIIEGDRKWYKSKTENIVELIIMVIVSIIRIEAVKNISQENQLFIEYEAGIKAKRRNFKPKFVPLEFKSERSRHNENTVADVETARSNYNPYTDDADAIKFNDYIEKVELALNDDEQAFFVFMQRLNGIKAPAEIAKNLDIDVCEVYNALKRVKRAILTVTGTTTN